MSIAFSREKRIFWFLTNNFVPKVINGAMTFIEANSSEQDLERRELEKKCDLVTRQLNRFLRSVSSKKPSNVTLRVKDEDHGEWHLFAHSLDPTEFKARIELFKALLEDFRQSLSNKQDHIAKECLEKAYEITNSGFILKELYADFLRFTKDPYAAELYIQLGERLLGDQAALYYEKALLADATKEPPLTTLKCSEARLLHCYVMGYLACSQTAVKVAQSYLTAAKKVNKSVQDKQLVEILDREQKRMQQQGTLRRNRTIAPQAVVWQSSVSQRSSGEATPFLGKSRTAILSLSRGDGSVIEASPQVLNLSGKVYEKLCMKEPENLTYMEHLLWWYVEKEKWQKAEYIGKILYAKKEKFDFGQALANAIEKQGKSDEAAKWYFSLAKAQYKNGNRATVSSCLREIGRISPNFGTLTLQEKQVTYLLALWAHDQEILGVLQLHGSKRISKEIDFRAADSKGHFGEWCYFQVDHPQYVACATTFKSTFVFTKRTVRVSFSDDEEPKEYPLVIPSNVPDDVLLFGAKTIRWLLANGYIPVIQNESCSFIDSKVSLEERALSLTHYDFYKAYSRGGRSLICQEEYAEFLLRVKRPELALELFLSLAKSPGRELHFLERALVAACLCKHEAAEKMYDDVLRAAQKARAPKAYIMRIALHGYLYFQCHDRTKEEAVAFLYNKAEGNCTDFLVLSAALCCHGMQEKIARRALYQKLCDRIGCTNASFAHVYNHYLTKRDLEGALHSSKSLEKFLDDVGAKIGNNMRERTRDMRQFVTSEPFLQKVEALKRLFRKTGSPTWLKTLLGYAGRQEYDEAEKVFLQALEQYRITEVQLFVNALYEEWLEFVQAKELESDFGPFFEQEAVVFLLRSIKDMRIEALVPILGELESGMKAQDYEKARRSILALHERTSVTDVQQCMQEFASCYKATPFVPTWEENFDQLFLNCSQFLPQDNVYKYPAVQSSIANYLYLHKNLLEEELKRTTQRRVSCQPNKICTSCKSRALYCLEHALALCMRYKDPRADEVYRLIYVHLQESEAPIGAQFLLCLHAFFYFSRQQPETGEFYFQEAERLNPESLLLACARIERYPVQATFDRVSEYNKIIDVCESERKRVHYLLKQKHFMGVGTFESSLETEVKARCKEILQNEQLAQLKRAGLVVVDTLLEKSLNLPAQNLFRQLTKMLRRFLPGCGKYSVKLEDRLCRAGYSLVKRKLVVAGGLNNKELVRNALETLAVLYKDAGKEQKVRNVKNVLDGLALRPPSKRVADLLALGEERLAAIGALDLVFTLLVDGQNFEASEQLEQLIALDPEQHFTSDQKFMYAMLQTELQYTYLADEKESLQQQLEELPGILESLEEQFKELHVEEDTF